MAKQAPVFILGFGILLLVVAIFVPAVIGAEVNDRTTTVSLEESDTGDIQEDVLEITVDEINESEDYANVTITDAETFETTDGRVNETETESFSLEGETIDVTLNDITDEPEAVMAIAYPPTYGWDGSIVTLVNHLDLLLSGTGLVIATLGLVKVIGLW